MTPAADLSPTLEPIGPQAAATADLAKLIVMAPSSVTATAGTSVAIPGLTLADPNTSSPSQQLAFVISTNVGKFHGPIVVGSTFFTDSESLGYTGTLAQLNSVLANLTFSDPSAGTGTIRITAVEFPDDTGSTFLEELVPVTVTGGPTSPPPPSPPTSSMPPTITTPTSSLTFQPAIASPLTGISIADADAVALHQTISVTLSSNNGTLTSNGGLGTITGNGSSTLGIAGSLAQVNADLASLSFTGHYAGQAGAIQIQAADGASATAPSSFDYAVAALPNVTINIPTAISTTTGTTTAIHGLSIADPTPPLPDDNYILFVQADTGTLTMPNPTNASVMVSGNFFQFSGTLASVNAALAKTSFSNPRANTAHILVELVGYQAGTSLNEKASFTVTTSATVTHPIKPAQPSAGIDPQEAVLIDTQSYLSNNVDVARAGLDPALHFVQIGWKEGRNPDPLFDVNYYLANNPDVAKAGIDPLLHYAEIGWKEGRDPSASFSTKGYLAANADVRLAGIDPLQHYLTLGVAEGRTF